MKRKNFWAEGENFGAWKFFEFSVGSLQFSGIFGKISGDRRKFSEFGKSQKKFAGQISGFGRGKCEFVWVEPAEWGKNWGLGKWAQNFWEKILPDGGRIFEKNFVLGGRKIDQTAQNSKFPKRNSQIKQEKRRIGTWN